MGIKGLSSFFESNPDLSKPYRLHNTKVVIDGNNLACALYFECNVGCTHGGDYDRYANLVKDYLSSYLLCDIQPIVIFDGGYVDNKLQTILHRANKQLKAVNRIASQVSFTGRVLPPFAVRVFIDVLQEMKILYAQCPFEADAEITSIANHYQCPVISMDSDFYIFDLRCGFIRLDYINVEVQKARDDKGQQYHFLNCVIYHIDDFLSFFPGLEKSVLPLFSTLTGNDFANTFMFDEFFQNVRFPEVKLRDLHLSGGNHKQMIGLLLWLKNHDEKSATKEVLKHIKKTERKSVIAKLINEASGVYKTQNSNFTKYVSGTLIGSQLSSSTEKFLSFQNNPLPVWFAERYREASLHPFLLNAVGLRKVFLQPRVEDTTLLTTYRSSLFIRQILYGLLLSIDDVSESNASENCVEEYDRKEGTMKKSSVKPICFLDGFGQLPKLCEKRLDVRSAKLLVLHTLGEREFLHDLPDFLQLYVMGVRYYLKNCSPKSDENFLDALLITTLFLSVAQPLLSYFKGPNRSCKKFPRDFFKKPFLYIMGKVSPSDASFCMRNLKPCLRRPVHNRKKTLILPIVHCYSHLQGCLSFLLALNELVGSPFLTPKIQSILSGSLIYNISKKLAEQDFPDFFIHDMFGSGSALDHLFKKLKKNVLKNLPMDVLRRREKGRKRALASDANVVKPGASEQKKPLTLLSNQFEVLRCSSGSRSSANVFL